MITIAGNESGSVSNHSNTQCVIVIRLGHCREWRECPGIHSLLEMKISLLLNIAQ